MVLPLPNLDDRRWIDLVEEGRALIPFYAPQWTDHNIHDPGITILELFAAIAEMDIYQLNRIPRSRKLKFLALIGVYPLPPRPARTAVSFTVEAGPQLAELPASVELEGKDIQGLRARFRTLNSVTLIANQLQAIQTKDGSGFRDWTARWQRGEEIQLLGDDPARDTIVYLGFRDSLPQDQPVSLFFTFDDLQTSTDEQVRLRLELKQREEACRGGLGLPCADQNGGTETTVEAEELTIRPSHHSVRTVWEFLTASGWRRLDPAEDEIVDETRSFTLNGGVTLRIPREMMRKRLGANTQELFYVRARVVGGSYDLAPVLKSLALNAVLAEQSVSLGTRLEIATDAVVEVEEGSSAPAAGDKSSFILELEPNKEISHLRFISSETAPSFRVLKFASPTDTEKGTFSFEAVFLGSTSGAPFERMVVPQHPVASEDFQLFTFEGDQWNAWTLRPDFDGSDRTARDFTFDFETGAVLFGDGEKGRIPLPDSLVFVSGFETRAQDGNLDRHVIDTLTDSLHNRALLQNFDAVKARVTITNVLPATGGDAAETLEEASERALELIESPTRAVTLGDYEALARKTPGVRLARVSARANLHPGFPCFRAPGIVTVIILPSLPKGRPVPSVALRRTVAAYLTRRRVIGTRVEVVGPTYRKVSVQARVQSADRINKENLRTRIIEALDRFFDPLVGGPDGTGWPFGRDVYRSEVLQIIDETTGVENVLALQLRDENGRLQCGNVCIGPTGLVDAVEHEIEVI